MSFNKLITGGMLSIAVVLALAMQTASAQKKQMQPALRAGMVVGTDWLAKHLGDRNLSIIHIAAEKKNYDDGHIPGARFLSIREILVTRNGVANELPPAADLKKTFEKLGIGETGRIIIYGENSGLMAARLYFTLDYLGHGDRAALLDGGLEKWKAEKREVSREDASFQAGAFTPRVRPGAVVEMARVRDLSWQSANIDPAGISLIDARPAAQYSGDDAGGLQRPGHIPGAVSLYWMQTLTSSESPTLKPVDELRKMYAGAGIKPGDLVVTYCRTGMQASHAYFTARYLGYNVTMYDGSMSEWLTSDSNPVVRGKERK